jgi:hypothetical protein
VRRRRRYRRRRYVRPRRKCKCIANRRCRRVIRRVYRYKGCGEWWPKPGKFVGNTCGYKRMIGCNANGRRCVVANRAWLAAWEIFRVVKS